MGGQQARALDPASQCNEAFMRTTFSEFPASSSLREQSGVPLGVVIQPLADLPGDNEIPVVNFGPVGVVRCRACRAYINPFVTWSENGRKWRCNLCGRDNDTGSQYYSHLDGTGLRADRMERPELHSGCVEIVAPQEYMVRPPQAPVYLFVVDVSYEAIQSGMLGCAVESIKRSLDKLPGAPRTQVGLVTFDYAVHFYSLSSNLSQPKMLVVSDVEDLFLPCPEDLLVNLADSRDVFEMLLDSLPRIHANNATHDIASCSAIQAAYHIMMHIGGKMLVFQTKLPSLGAGKLTHREDTRALGTEKERVLYEPAQDFYKKNVSDICKNQVAIELFVFANQYCDLASLHALAKQTGGQLHYYPRFNAQRHGVALTRDIERSLTRDTAWEAVFRLRASHGVRVSGFYGNFHLRGADLMQLPNCDADSTYGLELTHVEKMITSGFVSVQGALLYTNSNGQRRIRVMTSCFPVTSSPVDIIHNAKQDVIAAFFAKKSVQNMIKLGGEKVRQQMQQLAVDIMRAARSATAAQPMHTAYRGGPQAGQSLTLPPNLELLPLYTMALAKHPAFRGGAQVGYDERIALLHSLTRMTFSEIMLSIYPRMYCIDTMTPDCGRLVAVVEDPANVPEEGVLNFGTNQRLKLPQRVNLSGANLRSNGIFLLDNAMSLLLWVGRGVDPRLLQSIFGVPSLDGIDSSVLRIDPQPDDNDFKKRLCNILEALREQHVGGSYQQLFVIKEGDAIEERLRWSLVEDRASFNGGSFSYQEYISHTQRLSQGVK